MLLSIYKREYGMIKDKFKECIALMERGVAEFEIKVWHCRNCAEHGCGCCSPGDISFNEVGGVDWAVRSERA